MNKREIVRWRMEEAMLDYIINEEYEVIAKHCPVCESLVMALVVRTVSGEFYKHRDVRCSNCGWSRMSGTAKNP